MPPKHPTSHKVVYRHAPSRWLARRRPKKKGNVLTPHLFKVLTPTWMISTLAVPTPTIYNGALIYANPPVGATIGFSLAMLPDVNGLVALYDFYKILKITIKYEPAYSETAQSALGTNPINYITIAPDRNDHVAPATEFGLMEYAQAKRFPSHKPFKLSICPTVNAGLYTDIGTLVPGGTKRAGWIPTDQINIYHYGFKIWQQSTTVPVNGTFGHITCKYELLMKSAH